MTISRVLLALPVLVCAVHCFAASVSIADHGAVGDGKTLNTAAIQAAVDDCAAKGGGTVLVPAGDWLSGSIGLKSHIDLHLDAGAVLRGSSNLADYPTNGFKHLEMGDTRSFIWALHQSDISITGPGVIQLADKPFFAWDTLRTGLPADQDKLLADWQRQQCVVTALPRPNQPIFFHDCHGLHVQDITIRNSPCWTLTFSCSSDIQVRGIRIENNYQIPNNDGIHFTGSKNIAVSDCIIRTGDDCLAFSGITDPASVCEHIVVTNCILTSRSAGVRIGHMSGKIRDVVLSNLLIEDCNRGFAIQASDNGWVENVSIQNVVMKTRMYAGAWWGKGEPLVISAADTDSGYIRGVSIDHLRADSQNSILIVGHHHNVSDVTLSNVNLTFSYSPNTPLYGQQLDIAPAKLRPSGLGQNQMPWLYADDVTGLDLHRIRFSKAADERRDLQLEPVMTNVDAAPSTQAISSTLAR